MTTNENAPGGRTGGAGDEQLGGGYVAASLRHPAVILDDIRPNTLRAWASACYHLRAHGTEPLPPAHVIRALARRGWW